MQQITAKVVADSKFNDVRLTTVESVLPRWLLPELNTHRLLGPWNNGAQSGNSASSRAIPTERNIEAVETDPYVPATFNKRVKGMGVGEEFDQERADMARRWWKMGAEYSTLIAKRLNEVGLDKSRVNRTMEPYLWHKVILSATEWENFFHLRRPPSGQVDLTFGAQLEMQMLAIEIYNAISTSMALELEPGEWHLPYITDDEKMILSDEDACFVSGRRVAAVSFDRDVTDEAYSVSIAKAHGLVSSEHWSPFEHIARGITQSDVNDPKTREHMMMPIDAAKDLLCYDIFDGSKIWSGNLRGFVQWRMLLDTTSRR